MTENIAERRRKAATTLVRTSALASVPTEIYNPDNHCVNLEKVDGWNWSQGELVLVDTLLFILDIGHRAPSLRDIFYKLDNDNRMVVIEVLRYLNGHDSVN